MTATRNRVTEITKIWMSAREAEAYLGCERKYLFKLLHSARIKGAQDGKMTFFLKSSIDSYLESLMR